MRRIGFGLCLVAAMALVGGAACPGPIGGGTPTVALSVDKDTIPQSGGVATVTATLDHESFSDVTVRLAYSGTAESGKDYTRSSIMITIPAFKTTGKVTLTGVTSEAYNTDRTVIVAIDSVTNGQAGDPNQVTVTVTATTGTTPATLTLTLPDSTGAGAQVASAGMSEAGSTTVIARLSAVAHDDVTVDLAVSGTAVRETNYTLSGTQIVIPAGQKEASITVTGVVVAGYNGSPTIILTIASATTGTQVSVDDANKAVTITITDSEAAPTVTLALAPTTPISENGGVATATATISNAILVPVTIQFTFSGAAKTGTNFTLSSTQIVIPVGQTTGTLTVTGKDDGIYTGDQTLTIQAGKVENATPASGQTGTLTVTFKENSSPPSVSLDPKTFSLSENGGTATLTASLSAACGVDTNVMLVVGGTATLAKDYTISTQQITIPARQLSGTTTLTGISDNVYEGSETIDVTIASTDNGVTISGGSQKASGAINDDEAPPKVTLSLAGSPFAEAGGTAIVTATLSTLASKDVTVDLGFAGSATKDTDYTASNTQIVIPALQLTGIITLTGAFNSAPIGDKTIDVDITTVTNATEDGTQLVTATVSDSLPTVTLSQVGSPLADQGGATATVSAALSAAIATDVTVNFAFGGSATKDTDYTASGTQIIIPAGQTGGNSVTLTRIGNNKYNPARTIVVTGQQLSNAAYAASSQLTIDLSATTADEYLAKGAAWLAQNATQPGVVVLPDGLQYKIITAGTGAKPLLTNTVSTAYTGMLIDGTVFDSSPAAAFAVNGVIAGWTEALQLMSVGSKWMLYIPSSLGYGAAGKGNIPPNSALIFEIELLAIE